MDNARKFALQLSDAALRLLLLAGVHLRQSFTQLAADSIQYGRGDSEIAFEFAKGGSGGACSLRLEQQLRVRQDPLACGARAVAPGRVDLPRLPCVAMQAGENGSQPRALVEADTRSRHQILHRDLGGNGAFAHLLLNAFRKQLYQRQPP